MSRLEAKNIHTLMLQPQQLIAHHFTLDQAMQAYDTFGNATKEHALKVIATNNSG
jgi:alcohol dehydrogenase